MELDWHKYSEIADRFQHRAKHGDRDDLRQDIILRLAEIANRNGHEPLSEGAMVRIASYTVMAYWRDMMRRPTIISLDRGNGNGDRETSELWETMADDHAVEFDAWQDAKRWLLGCPTRLVQIAYKRYVGSTLDCRDRKALSRYIQKEREKYQLAIA